MSSCSANACTSEDCVLASSFLQVQQALAHGSFVTSLAPKLTVSRRQYHRTSYSRSNHVTHQNYTLSTISSTNSDYGLPLYDLLKMTNSVSAKIKSIAAPFEKESPTKCNDPEGVSLFVLQEKISKKTNKKKRCPVDLDTMEF